MKLILIAGSDVKEYSYPDFNLDVIRSQILDFCLRHQIRSCQFQIVGVAECNISIDNDTEGLSALFG